MPLVYVARYDFDVEVAVENNGNTQVAQDSDNLRLKLST